MPSCRCGCCTRPDTRRRCLPTKHHDFLSVRSLLRLQDLVALVQFGLEPDQVDEVARLVVGAIETDDVSTRRRYGELAETISRRWAKLVEDWTS